MSRVAFLTTFLFIAAACGSAFASETPPLIEPFAPQPKFAEIDPAAVRAAGIRKIDGPRLTIYSDLDDKTRDEVDLLPDAFAQAFPQWVAYFHVDPKAADKWRVVGRLMKDKTKFEQVGLLPNDLPEFKNGYATNYSIWVREQPSAYYRRHLVLHEGTHAFMNSMLGSCGPTWYMEGMAELLSTHQYKDDRVKLDYFPRKKDEVPEWGRVRIVQDDCAAGKMLSLDDVFDFAPSLGWETRNYAWSWAAAAFFDFHPRYRERFRSAPQFIREADFNRRFRLLFENDWRDVSDEWAVFVSGLEYGYDFARAKIDFPPKDAQDLFTLKSSEKIEVSADRGWQSAGLRLEAGKKYSIQATGRFFLGGDDGARWPCEANGVSIHYYRGKPRGLLLAVVRPDEADPKEPSAFLKPTVVGLGAEITSERTGVLFLKINDSPAKLGQNEGNLDVEVAPR